MIIGTHLFIPSYALCESYNNTLIKVDFDHALENELEKWKEGIYDDPSDVKTDSIKNIYNLNGSIKYLCTFENGNESCGFVVFKYDESEKDIVASEFCFEYGATSIYDKIMYNIKHSAAYDDCIAIGNWMYEVQPFHYVVSYLDNKKHTHLIDQNNNEVIVNGNNDSFFPYCSYNKHRSIYISANDFRKTQKYSIKDEIINVPKGKKTNFNHIYNSIGDGYSRITGSYSCGLTADLNALFYLGIIKDNTLDTVLPFYRRLFADAPLKYYYDSSEEKDGIKGFSLEKTESANVLINYLKKYTKYKHSYYESEDNPSTKWLKKQFSSKKAVLIEYKLVVNGNKEGHVINTFGWASAQKVGNDGKPYGKTYNYLAVDNGWDYYAMFINYTTVDFADTTHAYSIIAQK